MTHDREIDVDRPFCEYCGLPVRESKNGHSRFCCLGCRIAQEILQGDADGGLGKTGFRLGLAVFFSMNVMVFTMVLWSWDTYAIATSEHADAFKELLRFACLLFATPVIIILGRPLVDLVVSQIRYRFLSADGLLLVGVLAAFGYSVFSLFTGGEHIYFEVACMILLAVTIGRWIEAEGKQRATKSLATLQNLLPDFAMVINGNQTTRTALPHVAVGDRIRVRPGDRIPLDGVVVLGESYVDKRLITGESELCTIHVGDSVFGGYANIDGTLEIEVTATVEAGVIQRLVTAVNSAARQKSRPERLADQLAAGLAILIIAISSGVFAWHFRESGIQAALMASMAVVLIACPCALAVATPLAIWSALSAAARRGVVFRSSDDLLRLSRVAHLCFDKTGTITTGEPRLVRSWFDGDSVDAIAEVTQLVSSICRHSVHPLAAATLTELSPDSDPGDVELRDIRSIAGRGLVGSVCPVNDGAPYEIVLGSESHCRERGLEFSPAAIEALESAVDAENSRMLVGWAGKVKAVFAFDESLRAQSRRAIGQLAQSGIRASVLTGDHAARAKKLASDLQIDVEADLQPLDKLGGIRRLQDDNQGLVAMVGDGVNDAPALAAADVGIAMGCGAEMTRDAADVCLLSSDLSLVPWAIDLARATRTNVSRNLFWAVAYNLVGVFFAATGRLNPILAAAAMVLSSTFVISNSLRLLHNQENREAGQTPNETVTNAVTLSENNRPTTDASPRSPQEDTREATATEVSYG